jgi:hypothetical protein
MTYLFKLARRAARFRAPLSLALAIAFAGCNGDSLNSTSDESAPPEAAGLAGPSYSTGFSGGIPFGSFAQPTSAFGDRYNGAMRNIYADNLLDELKAIKDRGGKVMLNLAGAPPRYTDGSGHFSLTMWKASMDRFKGVDFSSYIQDGTVIGNFLLDEPNDPANWNGRPVPESMVEDMAQYSKARWPGMPTIVRVRPEYLTGTYHYLDAAWSQYHSRFGDPAKFVAGDVAKAKSKGLALVVGFNILKGNNGSPLTASQITSWGSALMGDSYACAFLSWKYDQRYMDRSDIGQALQTLSGKAGNQGSKSCRGTNGQTSGSPPDPTPPPTLPSGSVAFPLAISGTFREGGRNYVRLTWSKARTTTVDVYRNNVFRKNVPNDGKQTFIRPLGGLAKYTFQMCEKRSSRCSNLVTVTFR